jgi:hypothetical protein
VARGLRSKTALPLAALYGRPEAGLATTARHFSNNWISASAYSSADFDGFPENPAAALLPLPYPVVTAMNFISSSAISSSFFEASLAASPVGFVSAGVNSLLPLFFPLHLCP